MPKPLAAAKSNAPVPVTRPPLPASAAKLSITSRDPPNRPRRLDVGQHGAGHRAFDPRAVGLRRRRWIRGSASVPADVGGDRDRAGEVEQLDAGQPPQRIGRAVIAQLREQRRAAQPAWRDRPRRASVSSACARPIVLPPLAATARTAALPGCEHAGDADIDRLRRQHQPGAGQAAHRHVDLAGRRARPRLRA